MKRLSLLISSATLACATAMPAQAATAIYTVTGTGAWSVGATNYSGNFTLTANGQTGADINSDPAIFEYFLTNVVMTFGSITLTSIDPMTIFTNQNQSLTGLGQRRPLGGGNIDYGGIIYLYAPPTFATYNPANSLSQIATQYYGNGATFDTNGGVVEFQGYVNNTTFQAVVGAGAVPEPASWALMILGFGAIGATLRRRVTQSVSFTPIPV